MDNAIMIGLTRQMTLRRSMDVVANNIANANTAGFKVESLLLEAEPAQTATHTDGPADLQYVGTWGMGRDFRQGELQHTQRPFDFAIEGNGFFAVDADGEEQYTRDGRFHLDDNGQLVSVDGAPVLDADTRMAILLEPSQGPLEMVEAGVLMQNGAPVARIGVFEIDNLSAMSKNGNGRYTLEQAGDALDEPAAMFNPVVAQGYTESSNVQPVIELTEMMTVMRTYQSVSKFLEKVQDLNRRSIERLGKV